MRKLVLALLAIVCLHSPARAESIGIGLFVGEPLGLDLNILLQRRASLDIVIGATTIEDNRQSYAHLTYLHTLHTARGRTVRIPIRLGFGGAFYGFEDDDAFGMAARVPFELAIRFRRSPLEIYGEITFVMQLYREGPGDDFDPNLDGGVGLRLFF